MSVLTTSTASKVIKVDAFQGSRPDRPLYIYLPAGYDDDPSVAYPVIYMQDGQNCFDAYVQDSFAHSTWQADKTADKLISEGKMRPCIIVGVGHGGSKRMREYRPPYVTYQYPAPSVILATAQHGLESKARPVAGVSDKVAAYYIEEVASYMHEQYRTLTEPENTATCGSSMGGLFSTYMALEHPDFARNHAALSPSYWVTRNHDTSLEMINRIKKSEIAKVPVRIWLDSGTFDSPGKGDDGKHDTSAAKNAFLGAGYEIGENFQYLLAEGATHTESAWASRLDKVFTFLFPAKEQ